MALCFVQTSRLEAKQTDRKTTSSEANRPTKGSLTPMKPLPQTSLNFPSKLDPIPLPNSNKKAQSHFQSRGIVAPLEPPAQKEPPGLSLLSRDRLHNPNTGTNYGVRGPDHGPLAEAHSKELLNSIFKVDIIV